MRAAAEHGHPQAALRAPAVALANVTKTYPGGVRALDDVSITVERGMFLAVMGPSGSGKSTLMHCAAGLDTPTSGNVAIDGIAIGGLNETRRTELRRARVGFVFQSYNLVPSLSVVDNITLPLRLAGTAPDRDWVRLLVERVGLADRLERRPAELSGGQQQRAAIARALVTRPAVVFGDEPTGALDLRTAREVLDLLRDLVDGLGQTVVMVTHDPAAAARADQVLVMADGRVVETLEKRSAADLAHHITSLSPPDGPATVPSPDGPATRRTTFPPPDGPATRRTAFPPPDGSATRRTAFPPPDGSATRRTAFPPPDGSATRRTAFPPPDGSATRRPTLETE